MASIVEYNSSGIYVVDVDPDSATARGGWALNTNFKLISDVLWGSASLPFLNVVTLGNDSGDTTLQADGFVYIHGGNGEVHFNANYLAEVGGISAYSGSLDVYPNATGTSGSGTLYLHGAEVNLDGGTPLSLGNTVTIFSDSGFGFNVKVGSSGILRAVPYAAWSDGVSSAFFEVGTIGQAGIFATLNGANFARFGICTTSGMTISNRTFTTALPPTAIVMADDSTGAALFAGVVAGSNKFLVDNSGNIRAAGNLGVGNSASGTTLGSVVKKIQIFDASGTSLGYIPVYNSIT